MCVYNEYIVYSLFVEIKQQLKSRINLIFLIRVFTNFMYINIYIQYNRREYLDRFQKSEDVIIPSCNQGYRLRMLMGATVNKARKIPAFQPNDWNY